ncbi:MAG TPA: hypothetical protein VKV26_24345 [Dehalococcoidia bacterium]|nr:hypothetical protein [Dehalococcoidia bacterium]
MKLLRCLGAGLRAGLSPAADPRAGEASGEPLRSDLLDRLNMALAELQAARGRGEARLARYHERQAALQQAAVAAMRAGEGDEARRLLVQRKVEQPALAEAMDELAALAADQTRLSEERQRLTRQLEAEQARRQAAKAQRLAAEARLSAYEAVAALEAAPAPESDAAAAEQRSLEVRARAAALAELADRRAAVHGAAESFGVCELDASALCEVEQELAALRDEGR